MAEDPFEMIKIAMLLLLTLLILMSTPDVKANTMVSKLPQQVFNCK